MRSLLRPWPRMARRRGVDINARIILLTLSCACASACSSDGNEANGSGGSGGTAPDSCKSDPFVCDPGATCWLAPSGDDLTCQPSGPGTRYSACDASKSAPPCGDGLLCRHLGLTSDGLCFPFCKPDDPAHDCDPDESCVQAAADFPEIFMCVPNGSGGAGGAGGGN